MINGATVVTCDQQLYCVYTCLMNLMLTETYFLEIIGTMKSVIEGLDTTCISVLGDWNSNISDN